ncbi:MAG TPA: Bax inhibitor-1/YccA family protein [Microbacteriaceae bacterium]|nr:Bax inhibitor-1/YccA family protein [Microbacteriaceae bacterium]
MSNPALKNNPALNGKTMSAEDLNRIYSMPAATVQAANATQQTLPRGAQTSTDPMTYEDTIHKTAFLLIITIATAAVGWFFPILMFPGMIIGLVFGLINSFKKEPNVALIMLYAAFQGLFLGGISGILEAQSGGIVLQAVMGTMIVFAVTLLLFRSGKVRTSPKMTKIVLIAMTGYLLFSLVNFGLMMTGVSQDPWGLRTGVTIAGIPLGVIIGVVVIFLAAYSLVMDFEFVKNGVESKAPRRYGWSAAFGLMVTLIWLYIEILRLLSILRNN